MKDLVFIDAKGNGRAYTIEVPDDMTNWRVDALYEYLECAIDEIHDEEFLPVPLSPLAYQKLRCLLLRPRTTLNHNVTLWQHGNRLREGDVIDLSEAENFIVLKRTGSGGPMDCAQLDLTARNREDYAACRGLLDPILSEVAGLDGAGLVDRAGEEITTFDDLCSRFSELDTGNKIRAIHRYARVLYDAPFENLSKILTGIGARSGAEMWENIAAGFGGMCAEKNSALKFICDVLGVDNRPVFGATVPFDDDLDEQLIRFIETEGAADPNIWVQHHILDIEIDGIPILVDTTNGNLPFMFLTGADRENRLKAGMRARMIYESEKLYLHPVSNLSGDIMLTFSEYHIPGLQFKAVFTHRFGIQIEPDVYIGAFFDWHPDESRKMQSFYSKAAQKLGVPYPEFVPADELDRLDNEHLRDMFERVTDALYATYDKDEYSGSFTFVIQRLHGGRWSYPHVSHELRELIQSDSDSDQCPSDQ